MFLSRDFLPLVENGSGMEGLKILCQYKTKNTLNLNAIHFPFCNLKSAFIHYWLWFQRRGTDLVGYQICFWVSPRTPHLPGCTDWSSRRSLLGIEQRWSSCQSECWPSCPRLTWWWRQGWRPGRFPHRQLPHKLHTGGQMPMIMPM